MHGFDEDVSHLYKFILVVAVRVIELPLYYSELRKSDVMSLSGREGFIVLTTGPPRPKPCKMTIFILCAIRYISSQY